MTLKRVSGFPHTLFCYFRAFTPMITKLTETLGIEGFGVLPCLVHLQSQVARYFYSLRSKKLSTLDPASSVAERNDSASRQDTQAKQFACYTTKSSLFCEDFVVYLGGPTRI